MPDLPRMAISIRQPWAWAIMHAGKDIENRTWPTDYRGPVCVHAAKGMTQAEWADAAMFISPLTGASTPGRLSLPRGGIIGTVEIIGCVRVSESPWFFGPWGFVLANPQPRDFVPCRGALGFFEWGRG